MTEARAERNTPYASLRAATDGDTAKARGETPSTASGEQNYLTAEADKLENFKQALYAAFVAAPILGIPTALVDLTATYTSALRLQLALKGYSAIPTKHVKAPAFGVGHKKS